MHHINFSIIIPHKNIPNLLQRCLDSIPRRDDVQIIIVDDNSEREKVDFENFPGIGRNNTEVYFDKTGRGAGHARNVGLSMATGTWLIFADADDFFSKNFDYILDEHLCKYVDVDIVYYDFNAVYSEDTDLGCTLNEHLKLDKFASAKESIRYKHLVPWAKIIRLDLIKHYNCKFDEVRWGNDTYFNMLAGVLAKKVYIDDSILYIQTKRRNSLTSQFCSTNEELSCRIHGTLKASLFAVDYGYQDAISLMYGYITLLFQRSKYLMFMQTISRLKGESLRLCYRHIANGANMRGRLLINILFVLAKILPIKRI